MAVPGTSGQPGRMGARHDFGQQAEALVARRLARDGWCIRHRNWRFHHKEIDIVAERDGTVAFVEVKARGPDAWAHPLEAITCGKRRDLGVAARGWITLHGAPGVSYRFDAAVVVRDRAGLVLEYYEDAWRMR
jgi:putative endonuclease